MDGREECEGMGAKWVENQKGKRRNQKREEKDRKIMGKKDRVSGWEREKERDGD